MCLVSTRPATQSACLCSLCSVRDKNNLKASNGQTLVRNNTFVTICCPLSILTTQRLWPTVFCPKLLKSKRPSTTTVHWKVCEKTWFYTSLCSQNLNFCPYFHKVSQKLLVDMLEKHSPKLSIFSLMLPSYLPTEGW